MATASALAPVLSLVDGSPRASSLTIADHFGKRHKDVLRSITQTIRNLPETWRGRNFALTSTTVPIPNGGSREDRTYLMTRDGFSIVVMGFTGKEAMAWKVRYIEAFNAMERELMAQASGPKPQPVALATKAERKPVVDLCRAWVAVAPLGYGGAFSRLNAHFGLSSIEEMTTAMVPQAVAWLEAKIAEAQSGHTVITVSDEKLSARVQAMVDLMNATTALQDAIRAADGQGLSVSLKQSTRPGEDKVFNLTVGIHQQVGPQLTM